MSKKKIQDKDWLYSFLRPYVDWYFRHSYRQYHCLGKENIPTDGAIIYAPNHTNALQDAIAVLSIDNKPKVFVARADIFKKPRQAKLFHWLKIMPIARMRDGIEEVKKNDRIMDAAVDVLKDGVPFCILPEGRHRAKHSLLPLSKGIFRIAWQANEQLAGKMPVYIVPVGLEYGDYFNLWDSLVVNIGKPINVTEFIAEHADLTQPQINNMLADDLSERLKKLILYVPDDEDYEANWETLKNDPPEPFKRFKHKPRKAWARWLFLILGFPFFIISAIMTCPFWITLQFLLPKFKDPAFFNSVRWLFSWIVMPFTLFISLPFWWYYQEYFYHIRKLNELHKQKKATNENKD